MRIVASSATALPLRHPRPTPDTEAIAPTPARAVARWAPPAPHLVPDGTPDAGFVMQLIATAATSAGKDTLGRPVQNAVNATYGYVDRATRPSPSGNRIVRAI